MLLSCRLFSIRTHHQLCLLTSLGLLSGEDSDLMSNFHHLSTGLLSTNYTDSSSWNPRIRTLECHLHKMQPWAQWSRNCVHVNCSSEQSQRFSNVSVFNTASVFCVVDEPLQGTGSQSRTECWRIICVSLPDWYGFQKGIAWIDVKDTIDHSTSTTMNEEEEKQKGQAHGYSLWHK